MRLACHWFGHVEVDRNIHILLQDIWLLIKVILGWFLRFEQKL